ncbi:15-hydroxyprostaglandin dehydrogenase [NAD(+)]-like [Culicoides brevitarsis]|uniref:15-hydroxyprostaglandin dehydrogenase [NAD(+)]-like n=1 Tax=Culicoides brevitarsis TaxID=469753 RepID=UPI00307CB16D
MNFSDKSALIIGGLGGLGKAICQELVENGISKIGIIDLLEETEVNIKTFLKSDSIHFIYRKCSVTEFDSLKTAMKSIKDEFGCLDILINAAGIANELQHQKVIDINFAGTVNSTLIGIELMRKDLNKSQINGGIILNIASIAGLRPVFFMPVYSGTKHAIIGFTRSLVNDAFYERTQINFIVICPGATRTQIIGHENVIDKFPFPEMLSQIRQISKNMSLQEPEIVSKCVVMALNDTENGAVWQCENSRIEKLQMHKYPEF